MPVSALVPDVVPDCPDSELADEDLLEPPTPHDVSDAKHRTPTNPHVKIRTVFDFIT
jgi:hypothetical protein